MKTKHFALLLAPVLFAAGCATEKSAMTLDTVGPAPTADVSSRPTGALLVYSAYDTTPYFYEGRYRQHFSDYKILSSDGEVLQVVRNDPVGRLDSPPPEVKLPVGKYRVVAQANGYGKVTVPVVIVGSQTTTLHLEGGNPWKDGQLALDSNAVRLPGGEIVGWRAEAHK